MKILIDTNILKKYLSKTTFPFFFNPLYYKRYIVAIYGGIYVFLDFK